MVFLNTSLQTVLDAFTALQQFFTDIWDKDVYPFVTKYIAEWIKASVIAGLTAKIAALQFSWDIAKDLLDSLNVSSQITAAWSMLDSRILQLLTFFRIPEGINLLISASTTRFVYRFLGFGK